MKNLYNYIIFIVCYTYTFTGGFNMKNRYKVAIVGASGVVGRTALKVLEGKDFPNVEFTLFCSKKSAE